MTKSAFRRRLVCFVLSAACILRAAGTNEIPPDLEFTPLDDFENPAAWLKGDPKTDLEQRDAAVTADTRIVKQGKYSLLFTIRVNWKKRAHERYAKGWPMISRTFSTPQDWSSYDYLCFEVYPETDLSLTQQRVLRVGFLSGRNKRTVARWYTIPGLVPNTWNEVRVPLAAHLDGDTVAGIRFYVAEAWYRDGDRIDFHIDAMRLARCRRTRIVEHDTCARIFERGRKLRLRLVLVGPVRDRTARLTIRTFHSKAQPVILTQPLNSKRGTYVLDASAVPSGHHRARIEIVDPAGAVADSATSIFRSLAPGKTTYLNLITFYTKPLGTLDLSALGRLKGSVWNGVAIPLRGSYDVSPPPPFSALAPRLDAAREAAPRAIDLWPWVSINRMVGSAPDGRSHAGAPTANKVFRAIRALDLDDETGARTAFLTLFRLAVRAARRWKSPGIVLDPEAYNDYRTYRVAFVAERRDRSPDAVIANCRRLGEDMARIIAEEYPTCVVWTLFGRFERTERLPNSTRDVLTTPTYVFTGLLEYAKTHSIPLTLLDGGETLPGYCNRSLDSLREKIARRDRLVQKWLDVYPERLVLAGPISPFHDWDLTSGWIRKGYAKSPFRTLDDFKPLFRCLFEAYDWVWIYASSAAKTKPYAPENVARYGAVLRQALEAAAHPPETDAKAK
ncbi:MAG: hypothetical protein GXP31_13800 [Kiritimatiellaeota bacterium]|nr:hypothetical protein [Kiritimatiellota bacterium]